MYGVAKYNSAPIGGKVLIKYGTGGSPDYYINYNAALGINSNVQEAQNLVTVVKSPVRGDWGDWISLLVAKLGIGGTYALPGGSTLTVLSRDTSAGYGRVRICAPTPEPTTQPSTPRPTVSRFFS